MQDADATHNQPYLYRMKNPGIKRRSVEIMRKNELVYRSGRIEKAVIGGKKIPFRKGDFSGPAWVIKYAGQARNEPETEDAKSFWGTLLEKRAEIKDGELIITAEMNNKSSLAFVPDKAGIRLGLDTYMDSYPEWNDKFVPTLLCCEKTHIYGYFASPDGSILAVACPQPIAGWEIEYNALFCDSGHRIEGVLLNLLCKPPLPEKHPEQFMIEPGGARRWQIHIRPAESVEDALGWAAEVTGAPVFCGNRTIFEPGEDACIDIYSREKPDVTDGKKNYDGKSDGGKWRFDVPFDIDSGVKTLYASADGKTSEIRVYRRKNWSWYIKAAANAALAAPQKTGSHVESWYGLFSGFAAMRYFPDKQRDEKILNTFNELVGLAFDTEKGVPTLIPTRIQNTSGLISLCADAYQATCDEKWLTLGRKLADYLIDNCQDAEGVFRNKRGVHYTCVLYIAKNLMELYLITGDEKLFSSARRAVDELCRNLDNIGTEGEHTFEDGMISCAVTQISMFALLLSEGRESYIAAAEKMLAKHRCLERIGSPDCRSRNTTIRFWEAQYDVLIPSNFITSPHGWSGWKVYGTWYLYLLTGNTEYLTDTMETLGSCAQLISPDGELRWAYAVDPKIETTVFSETPSGGELREAVIGGDYVPMISRWYRAPEGVPVFGYPGVYPDFKSDKGGSCDNDVHEIFKAMAETVLKTAYIANTDGRIIAYNLKVDHLSPLVLSVCEDSVEAVHVNLEKEEQVTVDFASGRVTVNIKNGWICSDGNCRSGLPPVS